MQSGGIWVLAASGSEKLQLVGSILYELLILKFHFNFIDSLLSSLIKNSRETPAYLRALPHVVIFRPSLSTLNPPSASLQTNNDLFSRGHHNQPTHTGQISPATPAFVTDRPHHHNAVQPLIIAPPVQHSRRVHNHECRRHLSRFVRT